MRRRWQARRTRSRTTGLRPGLRLRGERYSTRPFQREGEPREDRRSAWSRTVAAAIPRPRRALSQISRGAPERFSTFSPSSSAAQFTAQTTTTVPTYDQKPSIEKFGAIHSARPTMAMLITR